MQDPQDDAVDPLATVANANDAIARLLRDGRTDAAKALVDSALLRWPRNRRLLLTKGDVLASSGEGEAAAEYLTRLFQDADIRPWAFPRLQALLAEGPLPFPLALRIALQVAETDAEARLKQPLLERLLERPDEAESVELLTAVAPLARLEKFEWKLAARQTERGELEPAAELLARGRAEGRGSALASALLSDLLWVRGQLPESVAVLEEAVAKWPDHADLRRRLIAALQRSSLFTRAGEAMQAALRRWPRDWLLLFRFNRLPVEPWRVAAIVDELQEPAAQACLSDDRYRLQFAQACLHAGRLEQAVELLRQPCRPPVAFMMQAVLKAITSRPVDVWRSRARFEDDRTRDVQVISAPGSVGTVIVPTGIAFGYLPLPLVDALFAEHGLDVVYLRDFNKRAYLRGVASLGGSEAETIAALRERIAVRPGGRLVVLGSSQGGFAALRYGALLGADVAVSFSGPTDLRLHYEFARASVWNTDYFIQQLLKRESDLETDLVPALSWDGATRFLQVYGADSPSDTRQALRLTGLPRVTLKAVPGVRDHFVLDHMIGDGSFGELLASLSGPS